MTDTNTDTARHTSLSPVLALDDTTRSRVACLLAGLVDSAPGYCDGRRHDRWTSARAALLLEAVNVLLLTIGENDRDCRNALAFLRDAAPDVVYGCEARIRDLRRRLLDAESGWQA